MARVSVSPRPDAQCVAGLLGEAGLPAEDLPDGALEHFFVASADGEILGVVGLELYGPAALLRSLVVSPAARGSGLGSLLVAHAEGYARERDVRELYLLTNTAERFFAARGYRSAARAEAPAAIRATRQFASLCPASAAFMSKHL